MADVVCVIKRAGLQQSSRIAKLSTFINSFFLKTSKNVDKIPKTDVFRTLETNQCYTMN